MKNKLYSVVGSKKQGHRIAVPEYMEPETGDKLKFRPGTEITAADLPLPEGTLVYVPTRADGSARSG